MIFRLFLLLCGALLLTDCRQPLRKRSLLVIGDSNGAAEEGWVFQLQQIRGGGPLVNTSLSGNTIGFSDGGDVGRNTLENLSIYLRRGYAEMGEIDEILIGLGTNDCKQQFTNYRQQVARHLETLLSRTATFFAERGQEMPRIVLLTPPAIGTDEVLSNQFQGAKQCAAELSEEIRRIANREGYCVADLQLAPGDAVLTHSHDGIHFDARGYRMLAQSIVNACY